MKGHVGLGFVLLILFPVIVLVPDLIVYGALSYKANAVVEHTTKEAEMQGGVTAAVEKRFNEVMNEYGMTDKNFKVTYDRTGQVEHRGKFIVELKGKYDFHAFNLLGTGKGTFSLPITARDSGVSEVWIR